MVDYSSGLLHVNKNQGVFIGINSYKIPKTDSSLPDLSESMSGAKAIFEKFNTEKDWKENLVHLRDAKNVIHNAILYDEILNSLEKKFNSSL